MSHSIVLMGSWFTPWPAWIDFFLISCAANRDVDWLIFSDQPPPDSTPSNVTIKPIDFSDYKKLMGARLGIHVHEDASPYKMCDFRPSLGFAHYDLIRGYDFFGFTDFDVIYGDIRAIYDDEVLRNYDALASHTMHVSGHLFLMRNTREMRSAFMSIPDWRSTYEAERYQNFDEQMFYAYFKSGRGRWDRLVSLGRRKPFFFRESYNTPMPTPDMRWYWKDGVLCNEFYPQRGFLYLHFMAWHSNKWYPLIPHVAPGALAPWQRLERLVQLDWRRAQEEGFMISPAGIQPIEVRPYP